MLSLVLVVISVTAGWLFNGWLWLQWRALRRQVAEVATRLNALDQDLRG